jgi:hypothetical protein
MFEKLGQAAEQMATKVSRRQFLGRLGRGAMAAAATVGGLLTLPDVAEAGARRCGPNSVGSCRGKKVGAICNRMGRCAGAPNCYCSVRR